MQKLAQRESNDLIIATAARLIYASKFAHTGHFNQLQLNGGIVERAPLM